MLQIVTSKADRAVMAVTIERDFCLDASALWVYGSRRKDHTRRRPRADPNDTISRGLRRIISLTTFIADVALRERAAP